MSIALDGGRRLQLKKLPSWIVGCSCCGAELQSLGLLHTTLRSFIRCVALCFHASIFFALLCGTCLFHGMPLVLLHFFGGCQLDKLITFAWLRRELNFTTNFTPFHGLLRCPKTCYFVFFPSHPRSSHTTDTIHTMWLRNHTFGTFL